MVVAHQNKHKHVKIETCVAWSSKTKISRTDAQEELVVAVVELWHLTEGRDRQERAGRFALAEKDDRW
jgi:hypothetical protein